MRAAPAIGLSLALLVAAPGSAHDPNRIDSGIATGTPAQAQIQRQMETWNRGDLEGALDTYCPTADITWASKEGVSKGYEPFARSMRRGFGTPARMGRLDIRVLNEMSLGEDKSLVTVSWSIKRGGRQVTGGVSSQVWALCDKRMRVVFEHAS